MEGGLVGREIGGGAGGGNLGESLEARERKRESVRDSPLLGFDRSSSVASGHGEVLKRTSLSKP